MPSTENVSEEEPRRKRRHYSWIVLGVAFSALITIGEAYDDLKPHLMSWRAERPLRQYKKNIANCVKDAKKQVGNEKVIGLEYSCAIQIAATFYAVDQEKALNLCMIYNPLFDVDIGREYSSFNSDDLWAQKNEQIARVACKTSIERELKD